MGGAGRNAITPASMGFYGGDCGPSHFVRLCSKYSLYEIALCGNSSSTSTHVPFMRRCICFSTCGVVWLPRARGAARAMATRAAARRFRRWKHRIAARRRGVLQRRGRVSTRHAVLPDNNDSSVNCADISTDPGVDNYLIDITFCYGYVGTLVSPGLSLLRSSVTKHSEYVLASFMR